MTAAFSLRAASLVHANGHQALASLDLSAARGECLALIGPSGAGKTSLIRLLGSSIRPSQGRLEILGEDPWTVSAARLRKLRSRIGVVHQNAPIPPRSRAVTAVLAGRLGQWSSWRALGSLLYPSDIAGASAALERMALQDRLFDRCDRLSGGQLQRVGVARVLYQQAELVLADEPVASLDPVLSDLVIRELKADAQARKATLVAALHAVDLALKWFPRIVGVKQGQVFFDLPAEDVTPALLARLYESDPYESNRQAPFVEEAGPRDAARGATGVGEAARRECGMPPGAVDGSPLPAPAGGGADRSPRKMG